MAKATNTISKEQALSADRLRDLLHYDPRNGEFIWRVARGHWVHAGERAGKITKDGYVVIKIDQLVYQAHRLAWLYVHGEWPSNCIDHIDGDRADNRISNLRQATRSQNMMNRQGYGKSGFKGVTWDRAERMWLASIGSKGRQRELGLYDTPQEAHEAYCRAAKRLHGEFACTTHRDA